ncbi:glycosyltransferase [Palleronia sediminis]|uniref:Glycosyltransferase n=1 Tax=Palleronia sediminis TaxID=2547833 RepID=A0A4R6A8Y5_9RHOB|nr:glycosyltransferase family 8 protein [Palleronia sediminis]TDL79397.1 glycosyltransferase [Palleronia sediminis]
MEHPVTSDRPAASDAAIVFVADGDYAAFALHAAAQIAALHSARDFDICLCGTVPPAPLPDSLSHLGIRLCGIATGGRFDGLRLDEGRTDIVYLRLALPEAFARDYRRVLYLDADIFVERGDFAALLRADLHGHALAAVRDNSQWRTPNRRPEQFRRLGLPAAPYFNAGVMLMDLPAWRAAAITDRAVSLGEANRERMIRHDQNLLNAVLQGDWAELHPAWNWQYTRASNLLSEMVGPNLLHFIGPEKPWSHKGGRLPLRFHDAFARFTAAHFGRSPDAAGIAPSKNRDWLRKSLWKQTLSVGRMCDYLDRFDGDLDILGGAAR